MNRSTLFPFFVAAALLLPWTPRWASPASAQSACPVPGESCGSDTFEADPPLLVWQNLEAPDSALTSDSLTLRFDNSRSDTVNVDIRILADAGDSRHKTRTIRLRAVAPGRSELKTIALADLGLKTDDMRFAGQIVASARIESDELCAGGACKPLRTTATNAPDSDGPGAAPTPVAPRGEYGKGPVFVATQPVFFHPGAAPGTFEIYGREVLDDRYAGGDLLGGTAPEIGVNMLRVSDGGRFAAHKNKYLGEMNALDYDNDDASGSSHPAVGPTQLAANLLGFCVKWEIELVDQGKKIVSGGQEITEDYWNGQPKSNLNGFKTAGVAGNGRMAVTARGVLVIAHRGSYSELLETNPTTGCVAFAGDGPGQYELTVLTAHHDARGNAMIYHGPGFFPWGFKETVTLKTAKTATVSVGDFSPEATIAAVSGFAMYRTTFGVTNKTMYIRNENTCGPDDEGNPNSDGGANSSAHFDDSGLASGIAYVRMHDGSRPGCSGADHRRYKFLVTHEIGHAWQLLNQKTFEPDASHGLVDPAETECTPTEFGYTITSLEHSAIGAREGMAHFYAATVWNSPASATGVFTWFGSPEDLEASDDGKKGGRLFNECTTSNKCGKATVIDWMRQYWDWHTPWLPGSKPHPFTTTQAYGNTMNDDGTARGNYFQKLSEAIDAIPALAIYKASWDHFAELNGVGTSPFGFGCQVLAYPGCDSANPYNAEGEPACPCADVQTTLNENAFGDDGYFPDGTGSYLFHGQGGKGQYCVDSTTSDNAEAVCNQRPSDGAPECMLCGIDTMTACACQTDSECQALGDTTLECWGGDDQGWPGSASGRCMPSAITPEGRTTLEENPWICLESCGSRGGGDPDRFECMYDQRKADGITFAHAQCVDVVGCSTPAGFCEDSGALCDTEATCNSDYNDCCVAECTMDSHCAALGFPDTYVCDGLGFAGFCVPAGCEFPAADHDYCDMFR